MQSQAVYYQNNQGVAAITTTANGNNYKKNNYLNQNVLVEIEYSHVAYRNYYSLSKCNEMASFVADV